uniref:Uncharacterized protein n=1 Tax=Moniliophthora roreri TaxID=221103 RepID=A0A0W0GCV6_MONRR
MADSGWFSLPTRRELLLLIFALATFSISYNLDASLHYLGLAQAKVQPSQSLLLHNLPSHILPNAESSLHVIGTDGLKLPYLQDRLEHFIYGTFPWLPHYPASSTVPGGVLKHIEYYTPGEADPIKKLLQGKPGTEKSRVADKEKKVGDYQVWPFNAFWLGVKEREALGWKWPKLNLREKTERRVFTQSEMQEKERMRMQDGFWRWAEAIEDEVEVDEDEEVEWRGPRSTVVRHVPGTNFAIIDHVLLFNGTVYVILEDEQADEFEFRIPGWQVISTDDASRTLGDFGVSWFILDSNEETAGITLLAVQKLYSSLSCILASESESSCNTTPQTQPNRVIYPNTPTFLSPDNSRRSPLGVHPYTLKSAWPHTGFLFREDWDDYVGIGLHETAWGDAHAGSEVWKKLKEERKRKPGWVFERVVVGFTGSDEDNNQGGMVTGDRALERVFRFEGGDSKWFRAPRERLAEYFGLAESKGEKLHHPSRLSGHEMQNQKRNWFGLGSSKRVTVVASNDGGEEEAENVRTLRPRTPWAERMKMLLETDVLICPIRECQAEAVWMRSAQGIVIAGNDEQALGRAIVESLGLKWMRYSNEGIMDGVVKGALDTLLDA